MNRIQNHKDGGIGSVYDRHGFRAENKRIMEAVAIKLIGVTRSSPTRREAAPKPVRLRPPW